MPIRPARLVVTSLSPAMSRPLPDGREVGAAYQARCASSWSRAGAHVVSVNPPEEAEVLRRLYTDFEFVSPARGAGPGAPAIVDLLAVGTAMSSGGVFALVNSDIDFRGDVATLDALFEHAQGGAVYGHRCDTIRPGGPPGLPYLYGYDVFFVDAPSVQPASMAGFRIGTPWWDYVLLYDLATRGTPLTMVGSPVFAHLRHPANWKPRAWRSGLALTAAVLRGRAAGDGPLASTLGHLCRSFEADVAPGYQMAEQRGPIGAALGAAMVEHIRERTTGVLWWEPDVGQAGLGRVRSTPFQSAFSYLDATAG